MRLTNVLMMIGWVMLIGCSQPPPTSETKSGGNRPGEFKGYIYVNEFVKSRFLSPTVRQNQFFEISRYFGESYPQDNGLNSLLGRFSGNAGANEFRNGTPNSVNMLLWYIAGKSFGNQVATVCDTNSPEIKPANPMTDNYMQLADDVFAALMAICTENRDAPAYKLALENLWLNVAGYDLPEAEMINFVETFATSPIFANTPPKEIASAAVGAITLNPYLILEN